MGAPPYVTGDYISIRIIASAATYPPKPWRRRKRSIYRAKKEWIASSQVLLAMTARSRGSLNMPARQNWFERWRLFTVLTLALLALSIWIAGMRQFEVDGVRMAIRFT